ncbi:UNVERIFIED_CONTAM: hypothetical protein FKN15_031619 [Acipenser sinensis]
MYKNAYTQKTQKNDSKGKKVQFKCASNFVTECRDRYFWMSTNGKFAGGNFRFDVIDRSGVYPLNDSYAAACGFTYSFNLPGDLIFRASFLACHVESVNDVSYALQYRFVRLDSLGRETVYPFSLSCSTESPWNPREIVCEDNYMEVSVRKNVPVIAQEGLEKEDWEAALSIAQGAVMSVWQVVFHQTRMPPKTMTAADARTAGYLVNSTSSRVIFRSPYGMPMSEVLLSHVIDNKYNQVYEIDLFLEHQWADDLWEVTQHRSFKPARSPYLPETPYVVNNTVPSEKGFTVTLGNFKPDVELKNLTLNGVPLTRPEAQNRGVKISEVLHPNGTKDFVLKVPFDNPLVSVEYIGALIRRYTLNINYTLLIVPQNEPYFHPAAIVCDVKDVNLPDVKSFCTNRSVVFEVTPGNMDSSWELCIGSRPLPYTIAEPKITIELPLFSIGYIYEVRISQVFNNESRASTIWSTVCFPNGVVTVVAVTMEPIPVVDPSKTTLLDKTCKPKEFDSTRALFTFGVNTCGTRSRIVGNYLIYENEVLYTRALFPPNAPVITRDSEYRGAQEGVSWLTIRCRYPLNDTLTLAAERKVVPAPAPYSVQGLGSLYFRSYDPMSRDVSYSQFYSAFPVSQSLLEPVFLQVELLQPHSQTDRLILQDCWATLTPELDSSPQWDLVTDRCLVTGDSYRSHFHPVLASTLPRSSPQLQRLEVRAQQSSKDSAFWRQVYFHCMAVVCDPNLKDTCNKTCVPAAQRSARSVDRYSQIRGYVSAGPVQLVPEGQVLDLKTADYRYKVDLTEHTSPFLRSISSAFISEMEIRVCGYSQLVNRSFIILNIIKKLLDSKAREKASSCEAVREAREKASSCEAVREAREKASSCEAVREAREKASSCEAVREAREKASSCEAVREAREKASSCEAVREAREKASSCEAVREAREKASSCEAVREAREKASSCEAVREAREKASSCEAVREAREKASSCEAVREAREKASSCEAVREAREKASSCEAVREAREKASSCEAVREAREKASSCEAVREAREKASSCEAVREAREKASSCEAVREAREKASSCEAVREAREKASSCEAVREAREKASSCEAVREAREKASSCEAVREAREKASSCEAVREAREKASSCEAVREAREKASSCEAVREAREKASSCEAVREAREKASSCEAVREAREKAVLSVCLESHLVSPSLTSLMTRRSLQYFKPTPTTEWQHVPTFLFETLEGSCLQQPAG